MFDLVALLIQEPNSSNTSPVSPHTGFSVESITISRISSGRVLKSSNASFTQGASVCIFKVHACPSWVSSRFSYWNLMTSGISSPSRSCMSVSDISPAISANLRTNCWKGVMLSKSPSKSGSA